MKHSTPHRLQSVAFSLIFALLSLQLFIGCDLAKPQNPSPSYRNATAPQPTAVPQMIVEDFLKNAPIDTSIKLDQTFEDKEHGFRFNYPAAFSKVKKQKSWLMMMSQNQYNVVISVSFVDHIPKTYNDAMQLGPKVDLFEKIKLNGWDCTHISGIDTSTFYNTRSDFYFLPLKNNFVSILFVVWQICLSSIDLYSMQYCSRLR